MHYQSSNWKQGGQNNKVTNFTVFTGFIVQNTVQLYKYVIQPKNVIQAKNLFPLCDSATLGNFIVKALSRLHFAICITNQCKYTIDFDFKIISSKLITSSSNKCDHWIWDVQIYVCTNSHKDQKKNRFFSMYVHCTLCTVCIC